MRYRWKALPKEQREVIRNYIVQKVIAVSHSVAGAAAEVWGEGEEMGREGKGREGHCGEWQTQAAGRLFLLLALPQ